MGIELTNTDSYVKGLEELQKSHLKGIPLWLESTKSEAIKTFSTLGFPTPLDEDWRFTNLAPISRNTFQFAKNGISEVSSDLAEKYFVPSLDCHKLIFVNGRFVSSLSDIKNESDGVIIKSLKDALATEGEIVAKHLTKYADFSKDAFISLNTAYFEDGAFVYVPKSKVVEHPIYVLNISVNENAQTIVNPRNLVVVEDNAEVKVIEHYVSTEENVYFSNAVTEFVLGENANAEHYMLEFESKKAFNISTLRIQQQRSSNIKSHSILLGGAIVRNNVHPVLNGEGSNSDIFGLYLPKDRQHIDNFMRVEHASPHCDSRQFYNGILNDKARGVFHGRIVVHEGAMLTDAKQTNRNLLLSDTAQIDTKPQLEIYNDDVKCTHGATIGQMDDIALFYLKSRGIPDREARRIMLQAFTNETLENMSLEPVRESMEKFILNWFDESFSNN